MKFSQKLLKPLKIISKTVFRQIIWEVKKTESCAIERIFSAVQYDVTSGLL